MRYDELLEIYPNIEQLFDGISRILHDSSATPEMTAEWAKRWIKRYISPEYQPRWGRKHMILSLL